MNIINNKYINKIIILTPDFSKVGGVTSFVSALKGKWDMEEIYFVRGGKNGNILQKLLLTLLDLIKFFVLAVKNKNNYFFVNTSFNKNAFYRDTLFLKILKILRIKPTIFIHGWEEEFVKQLNDSQFNVFNNAKNIFLLSSKSQDFLKSKIKIDNIFVETTVLDDAFVNNNFEEKDFNQPIKFLYLSRIEKAKGIWQLLNAFEIMNDNNIELEIVGYGTEADAVAEWIKHSNNKNIRFSGQLIGVEKAKAFQRNHIYILPSDTEGLPITILEAMYAGLPIISTKVGAIPELFKKVNAGVLLNTNTKEEIYKEVFELIKNRNILAKISEANRQYAQDNFLATSIINRIKLKL